MIASQMASRLLLDLFGAGLLGIATMWLWWAPDQAQIGYLLQATAAIVVALGLVWSGLKDAFSKQNIRPSDQLMAIAVLAACAYGDFVTATLVPLTLDIGRLFEERTALGVNSAIDKIRSLQVHRALQIDEESKLETWVNVVDLSVGETICVRAGERIPVDGMVRKGVSKVDTAVMTGESKLQTVGVDDPVFAGTNNIQGEIFVEVTGLGKDSAIGRIVGLMEEAQKSKPVVLQRLEQWLRFYVPLVVSLAATVLFFTEDLDRAIAVLIVSFPSSLAIAGSATMVSAFSKAAALSLFVKDATVFQTLRTVGTIVFDKTGTLTEGKQRVVQVVPADGVEGSLLIQAAVQGARHSNHPVSKAIVRSFGEDVARQEADVEVVEFPGLGVQVSCLDDAGNHSDVYRVGRLSWIKECGIVVPDVATMGTWVSHNNRCLGYIRLADGIRGSAVEMLNQLRHSGIATHVVLTGDATAEANRVATELGIEYVVAEALPEEKWNIVQSLKSAGHTICFIGDGINDALALQEADVGIAIGPSINQAAMGGSDVALVSEDLMAIPKLIQLSDHVHRKIVQNIWIGFGFALLLFAMVSQGRVTALEAALVHNLGALLVIANASLLWRR